MKIQTMISIMALGLMAQSCSTMDSAHDWVASKYKYDIKACEEQTDPQKIKYCNQRKDEAITKYKSYSSDDCYNITDQETRSDCHYVLKLARDQQAGKAMQDSKDAAEKRKQDYETSAADNAKLKDQQIRKNVQDYPKVYEICKKQREQLGPITEKLYSTKIAIGQSQSDMRIKELDAEYKKLQKQKDYVIYTYETNDCKRFFADRL